MDFSTDSAAPPSNLNRSRLIDQWSIEVLPRTAAKIPSFQDLLPKRTQVFLAHVDGTPLASMVETARRLHAEGFAVTPHLPARSLTDRYELEELLKRYQGEANVHHALLLAGGAAAPRGSLLSSFDLIETGLFDKLGFKQLHVAGHPEGNRDIDPDGSTVNVDAALLRKTEFAKRTDARVVITTQFLFDSRAVLSWSERMEALGVDLPIHAGLAGPAKLQTLIKYAITCGVGPSLKVLQKRALNITRLLLPYEPTDLATELERYKLLNPKSRIERFHLFPLGGIEPAVQWCRQQAAR